MPLCLEPPMLKGTRVPLAPFFQWIFLEVQGRLEIPLEKKALGALWCL